MTENSTEVHLTSNNAEKLSYWPPSVVCKC